MQDAMLRRDYDDAATLLHQSFNVDRSILEGSFAEYTVPTSENPDNPTKTISDVKAALFDIFSKQFDKAVSSRDQKEITRYFKLFPLIGCHKEGLQRYSNFVCGLVRDQGSESLRLDKGERSSLPDCYWEIDVVLFFFFLPLDNSRVLTPLSIPKTKSSQHKLLRRYHHCAF